MYYPIGREWIYSEVIKEIGLPSKENNREENSNPHMHSYL
jgi:hypothetical protein